MRDKHLLTKQTKGPKLMKTLALAGLMTTSAIMGSVLTLSLSQASFAQDDKPDDRHWTEQHPAGAAHAQQQATQLQAYANRQHYTEYMIISNTENRRGEFNSLIEAAMANGWVPQGGVVTNKRGLYYEQAQAMVR